MHKQTFILRKPVGGFDSTPQPRLLAGPCPSAAVCWLMKNVAFSIRFRNGLENVYQLIRQRQNTWLTALCLLNIHNNLPFIQVYLFPRDISSFTDAATSPTQKQDKRFQLLRKCG